MVLGSLGESEATRCNNMIDLKNEQYASSIQYDKYLPLCAIPRAFGKLIPSWRQESESLRLVNNFCLSPTREILIHWLWNKQKRTLFFLLALAELRAYPGRPTSNQITPVLLEKNHVLKCFRSKYSAGAQARKGKTVEISLAG